MIEVINRERCVYSGKKDLEHLFTLENFPLFMKCEDGYSSKEDDVFIDMEWYISKSTGAIQLKNLIPMNILYDTNHGGGSIGNTWRSYHKKFAQFIFQDNPNNILEIGGGHGTLSKEYKALQPNSEWTILEPSPRPAKDVKAKYIKGYIENIKRSDFSEDTETIVHSYVIEHAYYPNEMIASINKLLKNNQIMYVSSPNFKVGLEKKYSNTLNFEHTYYIDEYFLRKLLESNGFKILRLEYNFDDYAIFVSAMKVSDPLSLDLNLYENRCSLTHNLFIEFVDFYKNFVLSVNKKTEASGGNIYLFGAHVFAQYLIAFGLNIENIIYILDNDPNKQGKRLYGTDIKVKSPKILQNIKNPIVVLKAGIYNDEIKKDILENINSSAIFWD